MHSTSSTAVRGLRLGGSQKPLWPEYQPTDTGRWGDLPLWSSTDITTARLTGNRVLALQILQERP